MSPRLLKIFLCLTIVFNCVYTFALSNPYKEAHKCAVDLCGPAREDINKMPTRSALSSEVENRIQNEIDPMIDSLVNLRMKFKKTQLESLDEVMRQFNTSQMTSVEKAIVNMGVIASLFQKLKPDEIESIFSVGKDGENIINKPAFLNVFPQLDNKEGRLLIDAIAAYVTNKLFQSLNAFDSDMPMDLFLNIQKKYYNNDLVSLSHAMIQTINIIEDKGLGFFIKKSDRNLIKIVKETGQIPLSKQKLFISFYKQLSSLAILLTTDLFTSFSAPTLSFTQIDSFTNLNEIRINSKNLHNSSAKLGLISQKSKIQLKKVVRTLIASGITPTERKLADAMIEKIRHRSAQILESKPLTTNIEALQRARNAVLETKINWPMNQASTHIQAKGQLKSDIEDSQEQIEKTQAIYKERSQVFLLLGTFLMDLPKSSKDEDLVNIESFISAYETPPIKDAMYTAMKDMRVGWQAVKNMQYGAGVLAHEFGHLISHELGLNPQLIVVKSCTANQHDISGTLVDKLNPLSQAEEDWADAFSAKVVSSLAAEGVLKPLNMACLLLGWNKETRGYGNLSLNNSIQGDEHSSGLYRLIQTQIGMGQTLPTSCKQATGLNANSDFFKSCF